MSQIKRFIFNNTPVRGQIIQLNDAWQQVIAKRLETNTHWPQAVISLLGQMCAATLLLQNNIKFDGAVVLQILGDGPLKLAVVEANANLSFRATAKLIGDITDTASLTDMANRNGNGRCAITLDPRLKNSRHQTYQGIVSLSAHNSNQEELTLASALENYMYQSEQLSTNLILTANKNSAAGILIQRMPVSARKTNGTSEHHFTEDFNRICTLTNSITAEELLSLSIDEILKRLFWQEEIEVFNITTRPQFRCSCSRAKVANMLITLGKTEIDEILAEQQIIDINCDFCGKRYTFDQTDATQLFLTDSINLTNTKLQ